MGNRKNNGGIGEREGEKKREGREERDKTGVK